MSCKHIFITEYHHHGCMTVEERRRPIPIGVDDFKTIRDEGYYFIDKSELISDILSDRAKVYLFTRPRRFGKSLNLSMLDAFFNVRYKGNTWFKGLKISDNEEAEGHKNTYPVIYINMKDIPVSEYDLFLSKIRAIVYDAYLEFLDLNECPDIPDALRRDYLETSPNGFDEIKLQGSIKVLCRMVNIAYGSKPIILIDEYDNPINNAFNKKDYDRIMEFLRNFYSSTFKSNEHLGFAVITGVMQIAKESIFSGLNNLKVNNIFSKRYDERYGFTSAEVKELCTFYGHPEKFGEAKEWYDGYRFGDAEIYNPWSLLNYVAEGFIPDKYWAGTSGNDIIGTLLENADGETYSELQALAEGKPVEKTLKPSISMRDLGADTSAIYSVMAVAGYLNARPTGEENYVLSIPNSEMFRVFSSTILMKIHSDANVWFSKFFNGMEAADTGMMKKGLDSILMRNIPFFLLSKEKDYQLIIAAAAMSRLGRYSVKLEEESGNGRADITLRPNRPGLPNIIFELKKTQSKTDEGMAKSANEALCQIKEKKYFRSMKGRTLLYGICFRGKESSVSFEEMDL